MEGYKNIHIGKHIKVIAKAKELSISRACLFLKCSNKDIENMYQQKSLDVELLLKWSKLLKYNFFMFYHAHLQLYSPSSASAKLNVKSKDFNQYNFKKNIYCPEVKDWLLDKLNSGEFSAEQIIKKYNIPKTTLYRWKKKEVRK